MKKPNKKQLVEFYKMMVRIRKVEQKLMDVFSAGEILGFLHVSIGQEAAPVGVCAHLKDADYISTTHRGHGWAVAKGIDLNPAMAELFGKKEGFCLGRAGSMHLADTAIGIMGANGIVGGGIPIATGAAFAARYKKTDQVAIATFGEGATSEGAFHEALNFAAIKKLPIVYVCENNAWAEFSPRSIHLPIESVTARALAYNIEAVSVSNNVLEIFDAAGEAIQKARNGGGPTLLEVKSERWYGHYVGDAQQYRGKESVAEAMGKDCILDFEKELIKDKILKKQDIENVQSLVDAEVEDAVSFARECSYPQESEMLDGLYV
ncbi:MAG: thiamine pyrophosphate-dependent dehydrogenase E1 component subunit alpha [Deltaproteobacteria bacterium]|nr:thiamine pyrophosphate-dependent dehydrogenase E1 component subunit alpha [Deltaproteobacteria bacterium]